MFVSTAVSDMKARLGTLHEGLLTWLLHERFLQVGPCWDPTLSAAGKVHALSENTYGHQALGPRRSHALSDLVCSKP